MGRTMYFFLKKTVLRPRLSSIPPSNLDGLLKSQGAKTGWEIDRINGYQLQIFEKQNIIASAWNFTRKNLRPLQEIHAYPVRVSHTAMGRKDALFAVFDVDHTISM